MRYTLLLSFFLLSTTTLWSQSIEQITEYFDKDWKTTINPETASYYRTVEHTTDKILVRDYFMTSKKIQMFAECSRITPYLIKNGKHIVYYENGKIKSEGNYSDNTAIGEHKSYYEDGSAKSIELHRLKEPVKYIHYFSDDGVELLPNGKGIVLLKTDDTNNSFLEVEDSLHLASYNVSKINHDTIFISIKECAEYKGGLEQMYRFIQANLTYPKSARRMGVDGSVYIAFTVQKDGTVKDCSVIKGIHPDCDEAAIAVVQKLNNWQPAFYRGRPVNSRFVLPIKYHLTGK